MLEGDVDRDFLLDGLTNGFRLIDNDAELFPASMLNFKSATGLDVEEKVEKQITAELEAGNYVITNEPPTLISAIGTILKSDSNEVHLIHDCSRPTENSLNSHNTENETFKFQTMDDALKHIKTGSYLVKVDIRKVYRHVLVHPLDYRATGLSWQFELKENQEFEFAYLYDTKLPFGASKAPGIFHRLSQAITRIMRSQGFTIFF